MRELLGRTNLWAISGPTKSILVWSTEDAEYSLNEIKIGLVNGVHLRPEPEKGSLSRIDIKILNAFFYILRLTERNNVILIKNATK